MSVKKVIDGNYYVWNEWLYLAYDTKEKGSTGSKCHIDTECNKYYDQGHSVGGNQGLSELRDATLHEIAHLNACINAEKYVDPPTKEVKGGYYQYLGDVKDDIEAFIYKHAPSSNHPFTGFQYGITESGEYHKRTEGSPGTYWSGDMDPYKIVPATKAQIKHLDMCIHKSMWVPYLEMETGKFYKSTCGDQLIYKVLSTNGLLIKKEGLSRDGKWMSREERHHDPDLKDMEETTEAIYMNALKDGKNVPADKMPELRQRVPQKELRKGQRYFVKSEDGCEWVITWDTDGYVYFATEPEYVHETFKHYPKLGYEYFKPNFKDGKDFTDFRDVWYGKNFLVGQVYMYPVLDREYIVTYEGVSEGSITLGPFIHKDPSNQYYQANSTSFGSPKEFQKARLATDAEKEHLAQCEKAGRYVDYEAGVSWDIDKRYAPTNPELLGMKIPVEALTAWSKEGKNFWDADEECFRVFNGTMPKVRKIIKTSLTVKGKDVFEVAGAISCYFMDEGFFYFYKKWKEKNTIDLSKPIPGIGLMEQINIHGGRHAGKTSMMDATKARIYQAMMDKWGDGPITTKDRHSDHVTAFGMAVMAGKGKDAVDMIWASPPCATRPLTPEECYKPKLKCYVKSEVKPVEQPKRIKLALPTKPNPLVLNIQPEKTTQQKSEKVVLNVRTFETNH